MIKTIKPEDLEKILSDEYGIKVSIDLDELKKNGFLPVKVATENGIVEYHFKPNTQ